jgi:hypothetical protein
MCGAYGYSVKDAREIYDRFGVLNKLEAYKPRWNVRIAQMAPVIYMTADGVQIKEMYWSFIPSWGFLHIPRQGIFQDSNSDGLRDRELRELQHDRIDINASCRPYELVASMEVDALPGHR